MNTLLSKIRNVIDNVLSLENFVVWYEDWFDCVLEKDSLNENELNLLEELYSDIGYFEPQEELRGEHISYFDKDVLLLKLTNLSNAISK